MQPHFSAGDRAYYPVHGVAEVIALEQRDIGGTSISVYVLKIIETGLKIMLPTRNAESVGLRAILRPAEVKEVYSILGSKEMTSENQTWNRRHREYMEKIKTGSAFEIAEVLRDLCRLRTSKELSFGERRMLDTARGLLVREIAVAKKSPETAIEAEIDQIFQRMAA